MGVPAINVTEIRLRPKSVQNVNIPQETLDDTESDDNSITSEDTESDIEKTLEQQNFEDYFSDDEKYFQMPELYSFTDVNLLHDPYLTDCQLEDSESEENYNTQELIMEME